MAFGRKNFGGNKRKRTAPNNIADDFEREKHQKELDKFLKQLNEDGTPAKPATDSQIMGLLRGAIRERWMFAPNKLAYLYSNIVPDDDPTTRRRWKGTCERCNSDFKKTDLQVDHIKGENSLRSPEELMDFYDSIMNVGFEDLRVLCIPCHEIVTVMSRYNYTEEEAIIFKKVTAWESLNKTVKKQKELLTFYGFSADEISNKEKRRIAVWKYIESLEEK